MLSHPAEVANFIETATREMGEASSWKALRANISETV
jgi:hypothetical protein